MPSLVILIENVSPVDMENVAIAVKHFGGDGVVHFWTYESASLPSAIAETCFETHKAELEAKP